MHGMAERVQPAGRIDLDLVAMDEHDARGADRRGERPRADDAVADGSGGAIARPADDEAIGRQAQLGGGDRRELAGHFFRFVTAAEQILVQLELRQQRL